MNNVPEAVLQESLDFLERGESIEQIIARYPEAEAALRPFLQTAVTLSTLAPQPSLAARQNSQQAFLAHAQSLKTAPIRPSTWYHLRQILLPLASLAMVLVLFASMAVSVSAAAIPGDALYGVKRIVENVRLNQTRDPETAVALLETYRQERIREVQTLLRTGRTTEVSFDGLIEAMQPAQWTVASIRITLDDETQIYADPQPGELVRVYGRTANGQLIASAIELIGALTTDVEPFPTPLPSPLPTLFPGTTSTPQPTAQATTEPTSQPTAEAAATATLTPTYQPTATLVPTLVPTMPPSPVPTQPPGNDNGDNDNGNDNDDNRNDNDDNNNSGGGNDNDNDNDNDDNDNDDDDDDDNDDDD